MYPYHNKIKQRINNGELVDYYYDTRKNIGECLVLVFNTIPFERPIRPHRFEMYQPILEKWEKEQNTKNQEKGENGMQELKLLEDKKEFVKVYETDKGEKVVNGRDLWEVLGSKREFANWVKKRLEECDAIENEDYVRFDKKVKANNATLKEYIIKLNIAKEMAMLEKNKKGKEVRRYFIAVEEKYKNSILQPKSTMELLRLEFQAIEEIGARVDEVDIKVNKVQSDLITFKEELPLLAIDIEKITKAKNRVGVAILGGKEAPAYNDVSLRGRLYSDLNKDFRRQFNIETYKALKRNEVDKAIKVIEAYKPPFHLEEEIKAVNSQQTLLNDTLNDILNKFPNDILNVQ